MKHVFCVIAIVVLVTAAVDVLLWRTYACDEDVLIELYKRDLRAAFFGAFLTLGGFLLSLKTFIVVTMKKEVYDTAPYMEELKMRREASGHVGHYDELGHLSWLLFVAILMCLVTAVAQFTVGLIEEYWSTVACLSSAVASIVLLFITLIVTRQNLSSMLRRGE